MIANGKAILTAGAALLAFIAAPSLAMQGKGDDKGKGAAAAQSERGNKGGGKGASKDRGGATPDKRDAPGRAGSGGRAREGNGNSSFRVDNGPQKRGNASDVSGSGNRAQGNGGRGNAGSGDLRKAMANDDRRRGETGNRGSGRDIDRADGYALRDLRDTFGVRPQLIAGCPPGLAKERNGCLPPGQARSRYRGFEPGFFGLNGVDDGRYFYDDGYLLSYRGNGLTGFLPLLGGALGIGNLWPDAYRSAPLPAYYTDYFGLGDELGYRYADNVIYRVDPETAAITSVAGLLTGSDIVIGQPMPMGYDIYNVPMDYRDRYYDTPEAHYRYADGYVYEIDPATSLVASAIALVQ